MGNKKKRQEGNERDADFSLLDEELPSNNHDKSSTETSKAMEEQSSQDIDGEAGTVSQLREDVREELKTLRATAEDLQDKYLRALADLENYRKRALKERSDLLKYQGEKPLRDMLEVMDDLERALKFADADPEKVREGISMIVQRFSGIFEKWGIKSAPSVGKEFDPAYQLALSKVTSPEHQSNTVIEEFKKAYFYKDKLLRPAEVVVAINDDCDLKEEGLSSRSEGDALTGQEQSPKITDVPETVEDMEDSEDSSNKM